MDATSNGKTEEIQKSLIISDSLIEKLNSTESDSYFLSNHSLCEFQDYQAIISIQMEQKVLGFIVFKEKTLGTFSLKQKEEWFDVFSRVCSYFENNDIQFAKLIMKKKGINNYIELRKNSIHQ